MGAQKFALVLGGGGDPAGPTSIFDQDLAIIGKRLNTSGYNSDFVFGGSHTYTNQILKSVNPAATNFSAANAKKAIDNMGQKIDSKMKAGDQLVVVVDTHGVPKAAGVQVGHQVDTDQPNETFDLSALTALQAKAKAKGVKLAIVDVSCYSGNSLEFAKKDPGTCVVTSASEGTVASLAFSNAMVSSLRKGTSLEDSFLDARTSTFYGDPGISTPQGLATKSILKNSSSWVVANTRDLLPCHKSAVDIQAQVKTLASIGGAGAGLSADDQKKLAKVLNDYNQLREQIRTENAILEKPLGQVSGVPYNAHLLLNLDQSLMGIRQIIPTILDPAKKAYYQKMVAAGPELQKARAALLTQDPQFAKLVEGRRPYPGQPNITMEDAQLSQLASQYEIIERPLYRKVYAAQSAANTKGGSACQNFKF